MSRHLFVAATEVAAGELTQASRLARALIAAGDEVVFLLPRALDGVVADLGCKRGWVDDALVVLDQAVIGALERTSFDALVLVDAMAVAQAMTMRGLDVDAFIARARARTQVVALDLWSLDETMLEVDYGADTFRLPAVLAQLPRLVPVPFARPTVRNGYCALGAGAPAGEGMRAAARASIGADERRVVLWPIAAWQLPAMQLHPARIALATDVLREAAAALAALDAVVVQVGPQSHQALDVLGPRLVRSGVVSPARYAELFAAADLLFGTNIAATSLGSAIAAGLPALVAVSGGPPEKAFRVCPIGLERFLAPVLRDNPFVDAIETVDIRDRGAVIGSAQRLLDDAGAIAGLRARQAAYGAEVRALPGALEVYRRLTSR